MEIRELVDILYEALSDKEKLALEKILTRLDESDETFVLLSDLRPLLEKNKAQDKEPVSETKIPVNKEEKKEAECVKPKKTGYYASVDGEMDAQDLITKFNLNWNRGNIIKYVIRAGRKDPAKEMDDLLKAQQYISFEIDRLKGQK